MIGGFPLVKNFVSKESRFAGSIIGRILFINAAKPPVSSMSTAMVSKRVSLILVLVCSVLATVLSEESSLEVQIEALKTFNNSITDDPLGALADWTPRIHHCNWSGIACDPLSNVISISLVDKQLKGVITPFLGNRPHSSSAGTLLSAL